MIIVGDSL